MRDELIRQLKNTYQEAVKKIANDEGLNVYDGKDFYFESKNGFLVKYDCEYILKTLYNVELMAVKCWVNY